LYDIEIENIFISRDVIFHEEIYPFASQATPENDFSKLKDDLGWTFDDHMDDEHHPTLCPPNGTPKLGHTNRPNMMPPATRLEAVSQPSPILQYTIAEQVDPHSSQLPTSGATGPEEGVRPSTKLLPYPPGLRSTTHPLPDSRGLL